MNTKHLTICVCLTILIVAGIYAGMHRFTPRIAFGTILYFDQWTAEWCIMNPTTHAMKCYR